MQDELNEHKQLVPIYRILLISRLASLLNAFYTGRLVDYMLDETSSFVILGM